MIKIYKQSAVCVCASVLALAGLALADEDNQGRDLQVKLRLRAEYDDNVYERASNKDSSGILTVEPEISYNLNLEHSFVAVRYRPALVYWTDRPSDDFDVHHQLDLDVNHEFSPRSQLSIKDSLLYAELPQLMDRGVVVQQNNDYLYNLANVDYTHQLQRQTRLGIGGRYTILRYDDNAVADREDYDILAAGLTISKQLSVATTISGQARIEDIAYNGPDRDSDSIYVGFGVEELFNPDLVGSVRAGYQRKEFSANVDSANEPYVDASITVLTPSHRTRVTTGVGYSLFEADVFPYANQERLTVFASASHDLTARISLFLSGSYQNSSYNGDESIDQATVSTGGDEQIVQVAARGTYKLDNSNWIEAGYQYLDLNSDLRDGFDRNRVSIGWRSTLLSR